MSFYAILGLFVLTFAVERDQAVTLDNVPAFTTLCQVLKVAESPLSPSNVQEVTVSSSKVEASLRELVDTINGRIDAGRRGVEAEKKEGNGQTSETRKITEPPSTTGKAHSNRAMKRESGVLFCDLPDNWPRETLSLLKERIEQIGVEVNQTLGEIVVETREIDRLRGEAEEKKATAVYGDGTKRLHGTDIWGADGSKVAVGAWIKQQKGSSTTGKLFNDADGSRYQQSCGGAGETAVGRTLINDFFCLCGSKGVGSTADKCGNSLQAPTSGGSHWTKLGSSGSEDTDAAWGSIRTACKAKLEAVTPQAIRDALLHFRAQLGKGVTASPDKTSMYILGTTSAGSTGCTGAADANHCVHYYKNLAKDGKADPNGIPWETNLREAATRLQEADTRNHTLSTLFLRIKQLEEAARHACHQTRLSHLYSRGSDSNARLLGKGEQATTPTTSTETDPKTGKEPSGAHNAKAFLTSTALTLCLL